MAAVSLFLYTICDFYVPIKFGRSFVFNFSREENKNNKTFRHLDILGKKF